MLNTHIHAHRHTHIHPQFCLIVDSSSNDFIIFFVLIDTKKLKICLKTLIKIYWFHVPSFIVANELKNENSESLSKYL